MSADKIEEHEDEAFQLHQLAESIVLECKQRRSSSILEQAIALLRNELETQSSPHPSRLKTLGYLSAALIARFSQWGWLEDAYELMKYTIEIVQSWTSDARGKVIEYQSENIHLALDLLFHFVQSVERSSIDSAVFLYWEALKLRSSSDPARILTIFGLAESLIIRNLLSGGVDDLDESLSLLQDALDLQPPPEPKRFRYLIALGMVHLMKAFHPPGQNNMLAPGVMLNNLLASYLFDQAFKEDEEASELVQSAAQYSAIAEDYGNDSAEDRAIESALDRAIIQVQSSLPLRPIPHPKRFISLDKLGCLLVERFNRKGDLADLEQAITCHRASLELAPSPHPKRYRSLDYLADALSERFEREGKQMDLEESIKLLREAVTICIASARPTDRAITLNRLASVLCKRFNHNIHLSDLEEAISLSRSALPLHPDRALMLNNLGVLLSDRFKHGGHMPDLEEAIELHREALGLCQVTDSHRSTSQSLSKLSGVLFDRFTRTGHLSDLEEATSLLREGLKLSPPPHPTRSGLLTRFGMVLGVHFHRTGNLSDLEDSIVAYREALSLHNPIELTGRASVLHNLATALSERFHEKAQPSDLEEAIALHREAIDCCIRIRSEQSGYLFGLAQILLIRFQHKGRLFDLEEAIRLHREALRLLPSSSSHDFRLASLHGLASALEVYVYEKADLKDLDVLDEAISLEKEALQLCPLSHLKRPLILRGLGSLLSRWFDRKQDRVVLEEAIVFYREALDSDLVTDRCNSLHDLAHILSLKYRLEKNLPDLERSISLYRDALSSLPAGHPKRIHASDLGLSLIELYSETQDNGHLEAAMMAFREGASCDTDSFPNQFNASHKWAHYANTWDHPSALDAFEHIINLLPQLSSLDMSQHERQMILSSYVGAHGIASDACSLAIRKGQLKKAVEFISAGRATFWSQALQLRRPLDELQSVSPQLAEDLQIVSEDLEHSSRRKIAGMVLDRNIRDLENEASRCRRLNERRDQILDKVRKIPGFEDFMLSKSFDKLQLAAVNGPVIIISGTETGSTGLLLNHGGVELISFPLLNSKTVSLLRRVLETVLEDDGLRSGGLDAADIRDLCNLSVSTDKTRKGIRVPEPGNGHDDVLRAILGSLWFGVAIHVLDVLRPDIEKSRPHPLRLWWCPVGDLSFLPLHAAEWNDNGVHESLSNFVISSYIPTLDSLLDLPQKQSDSDEFRMLAVIEAHTPGQYKLPHALEELETIQKYVPETWLQSTGGMLKPASSTVEGVSSALANTSFAHFACHGLQDTESPLESALFLTGGRLTISKIMEHPLEKARLAFLNACETARGDEGLPDEAMHLSASLLFAGFRGVVGTMWPIRDSDAPFVADTFYSHLFRNGAEAYPDASEAAYALHLAVKKL